MHQERVAHTWLTKVSSAQTGAQQRSNKVGRKQLPNWNSERMVGRRRKRQQRGTATEGEAVHSHQSRLGFPESDSLTVLVRILVLLKEMRRMYAFTFSFIQPFMYLLFYFVFGKKVFFRSSEYSAAEKPLDLTCTSGCRYLSFS